jgi:2-isopropylmalate synthase
LVNCKLLGLRDDDLTHLPEYIDVVSVATRMPVPVNAPVVGRDAFRTATGVHAAAVVKAQKKGHNWLADRVYSGVPAAWIGRTQQIEIGPMSGNSNVHHYLAARGIANSPELVRAILDEAKKCPRLLNEQEVLRIVRQFRSKSKTAKA